MEVLEYQLKHAPVRENAKWLAQLRAQGRLKKLPGMDDAQEEETGPQLSTGALETWIAFGDLSSQRTYAAHGPQSIPFSEIICWADINDVSSFDRVILSNNIVKMDRAYLEHVYAQMKAERDKRAGAQNLANMKSSGGLGQRRGR